LFGFSFIAVCVSLFEHSLLRSFATPHVPYTRFSARGYGSRFVHAVPVRSRQFTWLVSLAFSFSHRGLWTVAHGCVRLHAQTLVYAGFVRTLMHSRTVLFALHRTTPPVLIACLKHAVALTPALHTRLRSSRSFSFTPVPHRTHTFTGSHRYTFLTPYVRCVRYASVFALSAPPLVFALHFRLRRL